MLFALLLTTFAHAETYRLARPACGQTAATELYARQNFDSFPCDLRHIKKKPKIWVIGETHAYASLNPDLEVEERKKLAAMAEFWKFVEEQAVASQIYWLQEGYIASTDGRPQTVPDYVARMRNHEASLPLEDGFSYTLAIFTSVRIAYQASMFSTVFASDKPAAEKQFRHFAAWLLRLVWSSPYLTESFKRVPRPLKNPNSEAAAKRLDEVACDPSGDDKLEAWVDSAEIEKAYDLAELFEAVGRAFAARLGDIKVHQLTLPLDPFRTMLPSLNRSNAPYAEWQDQGLNLTSPVREANMAANTATAYCAMFAAGTVRPLVLQVGSKHVPGLLQRLKAMGVKSGLNPRLIRTRLPQLKDEP